MEDSGQYESGERTRKLMGWSIVAAGLGFIFWFGAEVFIGSLRDVVFNMARIHYGTVVGIPCCALGALFIVLLLRNVAGDIHLTFWGANFAGASGPIIMWILCFWALTLAMIKTWNLTAQTNPTTIQAPSKSKF